MYDAAALTNLATIAAKVGETDRAIELANRADALEPDHLGLLSYQKGVMLSSIAEVLATTDNVQEAADFVARAEALTNATSVVSEFGSDGEIRRAAIEVAQAGDFELAEALVHSTTRGFDDGATTAARSPDPLTKLAATRDPTAQMGFPRLLPIAHERLPMVVVCV